MDHSGARQMRYECDGPFRAAADTICIGDKLEGPQLHWWRYAPYPLKNRYILKFKLSSSNFVPEMVRCLVLCIPFELGGPQLHWYWVPEGRGRALRG